MEYIPRVWTAIFVVKNWKFLLWRRKTDFWVWKRSLPWWHLEFWESLEDCAKRETKEEFNIDIEEINFLWISNDIKKEKHYVSIFMISKYVSWEVNLSIFDEFDEYIWSDWDNLPENLFYILKNFLNKNENITKKILKLCE